MANLKETINNLKRITKYGISMLAVLCMVHCGLLYFGYDLFPIHALLCVFALILGLHLSRVFGLCLVHRLCVIYVCLVLFCIVLRRHDIFNCLSIDVTLARGLVFVIGIMLTTLLIYKKCG